VAALGRVDAAVVLPGEQPWIMREAIDAVLGARAPARVDAVAASYDAPGHPIVLERPLLDRVVVQRGWRVSRQYGIFATPVAFAIDESGRIAREVAKGPDEIVTMIRARAPKGGAYGRAVASCARRTARGLRLSPDNHHRLRLEVFNMEERLERLSRGMAGAKSRRQALKIFGAGLLGTSLAGGVAGSALAAPKTCVTCICGTGRPCNPKSTTCTLVRGFPAEQACQLECERKGQRLCGVGNSFHCPRGCP
jgi:hypothetical protein